MRLQYNYVIFPSLFSLQPLPCIPFPCSHSNSILLSLWYVFCAMVLLSRKKVEGEELFFIWYLGVSGHLLQELINAAGIWIKGVIWGQCLAWEHHFTGCQGVSQNVFTLNSLCPKFQSELIFSVTLDWWGLANCIQLSGWLNIVSSQRSDV